MQTTTRPDTHVRRLPWLAAPALLVLFVLIVGPVLAAVKTVNGEGLLWKVAREGVEPSYLFGTIHITDDRVLDLPEPVRAAFAEADSAVFEVIMSEELKMQMGRSMVLTDGRTLDSMVGPELYARAVEAGERYGFAPTLLRFFKPWALALIFSVPESEMARKATGDLPLDQWLQEKAAETGKSVHALESGEEQISLFNDLPEADQVKMLEVAIEQNQGIEKLFDEMVRLYLERDVAAITAKMDQQAELDREFAELFLLRFNDERNRTMVERMAERLREGGAFIAIGALHLPGEQGLVSLLRQQGYRVERIY